MQVNDLSMIATVGKERMTKYCEDYVLGNEPLKNVRKIQNFIPLHHGLPQQGSKTVKLNSWRK